jgi:hypothetical protein
MVGEESLPKLSVRRETIRALATLELVRAVGGDTAQTITRKANCTTGLINLPADR